MPEALSSTEIDRQHLEVLPARTVMSVFMTVDGATGGTDTPSTGDSGASSNPVTKFFASITGFLTPVSKLVPSPGK